jgi:hypothetical protein
MTTIRHGDRGATVQAACSRSELAEREQELHQPAGMAA